TIVRIKYVRQNENESSGLVSVWAIGTYPVGHEDYEIEIILFVSIDLKKRDPDTQAIFEKNEFYLVGCKIVPEKYNNSIRLKEVPKEVDNDDNAVFDMFVNDYSSQNYKFTIKVAYPYLESRFGFIKNVGQMEIINDSFFVYAKDMSNVDITKLKVSDDNNFQMSSKPSNLTCSRLL
ncbi:3007_t:CDS:2, partial [Cetraspora pellucida]